VTMEWEAEHREFICAMNYQHRMNILQQTATLLLILLIVKD